MHTATLNVRGTTSLSNDVWYDSSDVRPGDYDVVRLLRRLVFFSS